jgi:hypothetical protein
MGQFSSSAAELAAGCVDWNESAIRPGEEGSVIKIRDIQLPSYGVITP